MKKLVMTLAIVLGMGGLCLAQNGGGLFSRGPMVEETYYNNNRDGGSSPALLLPTQHGTGQDAQGAPLGSGMLLLTGMGAAYLMSKKKKD